MNENKVKQMTAQEAIKAIENNRPTHGYTILCEALDMAIKALEKQADIERALERLEELAETYLGDANCAVYESIEIIKEELHGITSAEQ